MKNKTITLMLAAFCAWAGSHVALAQSNLAEELNIDLTATIAGSASTNTAGVIRPAKIIHLDKTDVISALGASIGTVFSTRAKLLLVETPEGAAMVAVTDGTNSAVDVSGFLDFDRASNNIESVSFNRFAAASETNIMAFETFSLQDRSDSTTLPWHFTVYGVSEAERSGIESGTNGIIQNFSMSAEVSGTGDYNGAFAI